MKNLEKITDNYLIEYANKIGNYWGTRQRACEFYKIASSAFNVRSELVEDVSEMYFLVNPGQIYHKMIELGYELDTGGLK